MNRQDAESARKRQDRRITEGERGGKGMPSASAATGSAVEE
jgi:hypothetical protein